MMNYEKLFIWKEAGTLCKEIYEITKNFPKEEQFGLISQIRRSAISVSSNIAEGCYRGTKKEFRNFLFISRGSLAELDTQIILAERLSFIGFQEKEAMRKSIFSLMKMITVFIGKISYTSKTKTLNC